MATYHIKGCYNKLSCRQHGSIYNLSVELTTIIVSVVTCNSKSTLPKKQKSQTQFPKTIGN